MAGAIDYKVSIDNSAATAALSQVKNAVAAVAAAFAGFKGIQGIVSGVGDAIKKGTDLSSLSTQTGVAVKDLVTLERALVMVNDSADSLPGAMMQLQKALGGVNDEGAPTGKVFAQLGLSVADLKKKSAPDVLAAIQQGMQKLPDAASRTAAAMQIFGRSGQGMLEIMNSPGVLEAAKKNAAGAASVWQRNAEVFSQLYVNFHLFREGIKDAFAGVASGLAPALQTVTELMAKIDFAKWGEKIGDITAFITDAFKRGNIGEVAMLSLKIGFGEAVNYLAGALGTTFDVLAGVMPSIFSTDFFKGLVAGFEGLGDKILSIMLKVFREPIVYFQAGIQKAVEEVMEKLGKIPKLGDWLGLKDFKAQDFQAILADRRAEGAKMHIPGAGELSGKELGDRAAEKFAEAGQLLKGPVEQMSATLINALKNFKSGGIIDTEEMKSVLSGLFADFEKTRQAVADSQHLTAAAEAKDTGVKVGKSGADNADQFAKIGWFIGGGPSQDYARRTASSTENLLRMANLIYQRINPARDLAAGASWS